MKVLSANHSARNLFLFTVQFVYFFWLQHNTSHLLLTLHGLFAICLNNSFAYFSLQYSVVEFHDRRPDNDTTRHLFFIFFEWKNDIVEESHLLYTTSPWSIGAGLCGVFLMLERGYQLAQISYKRVHKDKVKRALRQRTLRELKQQQSLSTSTHQALRTSTH